MNGNSAKLHDWPIMGSQLLVQWTTQHFSLYQDCHHIPAAVRLQHRDQQINKIISENWEYYQIQSRLEVTSMHAGNRCWQTLTSRPRETVKKHTKIFRRGVQGGSNARHSWLVTHLHSQSRGPGGGCARTFLWKREFRFGRWCFKSGDTKTEAWCSCLLPQKQKGSIPRTEELGDLKTVERKSESRNNHQFAAVVQDLSGYYPWKTKTSLETEKNLRQFVEPSRKPKVIQTNDSLQILWIIIMESSSSYTSTIRDKRNCRTSCTLSKRRGISRIVAIWIGWKVMVRFHGMLLLSARCPKPLDKWKIQIWTKIWWISQRTNYTIWRTGWMSPKTQRKIRQEFFNLERNYHKEFYWLYFLRGAVNLGKRYSDHWHWRVRQEVIDEVRNKCISNVSQKTECERSLANPNRWRICIFCDRWFETTNSKNPPWDGNPP